ncbi:MAG: hypothetical protein H6836_09700 [Planctomycetes bacterium]|nr:hypothetical protein [Planctomycetota bacterium]MCB9889837.1 hypothetical protein [Planctomycetota bacterium]
MDSNPLRLGAAVVFSSLLLVATASAQVDEEGKFLKQQAEALSKFAESALKAGFPGMARPVWLEVLADYDKDDALARKGLGFVRVGTAWAPKPGFNYPEADNPSAGVARSVKSRWDSVAKQVGSAHKKLATELRQAGRTDRAKYHTERALRFLPNDPELRTALGHREFGGLSGTELEQQLFDRSRLMDQLVQREQKKQYEAKVVDGAPPPRFLAKVGVQAVCAKSEHFTMWGEYPGEVLVEAAKNAERALAFCTEAMVGERFSADNVKNRVMVFLNGPDQQRKVISSTPEVVPDANRRKFILEGALGIAFTLDGVGYRMLGPTRPQVIQDAAVRWVAQPFSGTGSDGLREGIGHAVVGRFFRQNLIFNVAQQTGNTVTQQSRKLLLPDMDTWVELAIETAFNPRGTKAARLPLIKAAEFPTDGRIKAWSFCDYLLRRNPTFITALDRTRGSHNEGEVAKKFLEATGVSIDTLEKEWRDFWTGASPVLRALRQKAPALHAVSSGAAAWIAELSKVRAQYATPGSDSKVVWHAGYSERCRQHAEYLQRNSKARGPLEEHLQREGQPGATRAGSLFANAALVSTRGSAAKAMHDWIDIPGYRDAVLNPYLRAAGVYVKGSIAVLDVVRGCEFPQQAKSRVWPMQDKNNKALAPRSIDVKLLGPEVRAELEKLGKGKLRTVGYPITVHTWRDGSLGGEVTFQVNAGGKAVEGLTLFRGWNRCSSAPGMALFVPFEPLPGGDVTVQASNPNKQLARWRFKVK